MKFAEVLIMETRVVDEARVKAEVKSAHIRALKARFREKKNCCQEHVSGRPSSMEGKDDRGTSRIRQCFRRKDAVAHMAQDNKGRTARISISTTLLVEESPNALEIPEAHEEVSSVVVLRRLALRILRKMTLCRG